MSVDVVHLLNYGWPWIDGYTIRSAGLVTAQRERLGWRTRVVTGPYPPFARARDEDFTTTAWGPDQQSLATGSPQAWERPALRLAPVTHRRATGALRTLLAGDPPDLLHVHHPHALAAIAAPVATELGVPLVYEVRCFNGDYDLDRRHPWARARGRLANRWERTAARAADHVVTIGDALAQRPELADVEVTVVRNSVARRLFAPDGDVAVPAHAATAALHVGYATTFERIEGLDRLVEAVDGARRRGADVRATIAGTGRDWDRIAGLVAARGLQDVVHLPGFVPYRAMPALLRSMDLFVVPRHDATVVQDTTPLKPLEALACGTPVVAHDLPAIRELLAAHPDVTLVADLAELVGLLVDAAGSPPPRGDGDVGDRTWDAEVLRYRDVADAARTTRGIR